MNRKEWLETFLRLADNNAPAIEYRKYLRIMNKDLRKHVRKTHEYRAELEEILTAERKAERAAKARQQQLQESAKRAREAKVARERRAAAERARRDNDAEDSTEAVGPRGDSDSDS